MPVVCNLHRININTNMESIHWCVNRGKVRERVRERITFQLAPQISINDKLKGERFERKDKFIVKSLVSVLVACIKNMLIKLGLLSLSVSVKNEITFLIVLEPEATPFFDTLSPILILCPCLVSERRSSIPGKN